MVEEEPGSPRIIKVTISPRGKGEIEVFSGDPHGHQPSVPEQMNGAAAWKIAHALHECTSGYKLVIDDQTWQN